MTYPNLISATIPKKDLIQILKAIEFIDSKLPYLVNLTEEEMSSLPKMRFNTISFVKECLHYATMYPQHVPKDVDIREVEKDVELHNSVIKILESLKQLVKKLEDNALLAESEAYLPSISIYNSVKSAKAARTGTVKDLTPA